MQFVRDQYAIEQRVIHEQNHRAIGQIVPEQPNDVVQQNVVNRQRNNPEHQHAQVAVVNAMDNGEIMRLNRELEIVRNENAKCSNTKKHSGRKMHCVLMTLLAKLDYQDLEAMYDEVSEDDIILQLQVKS